MDPIQYEIDGIIEDMGREAIRLRIQCALHDGIDLRGAPITVGRRGCARYTLKLLKRFLYRRGFRP